MSRVCFMLRHWPIMQHIYTKWKPFTWAIDDIYKMFQINYIVHLKETFKQCFLSFQTFSENSSLKQSHLKYFQWSLRKFFKIIISLNIFQIYNTTYISIQQLWESTIQSQLNSTVASLTWFLYWKRTDARFITIGCSFGQSCSSSDKGEIPSKFH